MSDKNREEVSHFVPITQWPEGERPREKLLAVGEEHLSHAELIAILLRTGTKNRSAVDIAKQLLLRGRHLVGLAAMSVSELENIPGIGSAKAVTIKAVFELGRRLAGRGELTRRQFRSPSEVAAYFIPRLRDLKKEVFKVVILDSKNKIIKDLHISEGAMNSSIVHPREVYKPAISESAAAIILIHNHPSGDPEPSEEDIKITQVLMETGEVIGIPVLDHIIIAGNDFFSFKDKGLLNYSQQA